MTTAHTAETVAVCVCSEPWTYCGGADTDSDEIGYCQACAELDGEEHCLRCPFECCAQYDGSEGA